MLKVTGWACGDGVESGGRASVRLGLPARWESSMANGPVDGYTVNELADAYAAMESMVQAPHFAQDQQGLVDAVTAHVAGADCASITELRCGAFVVTLAASAQAARDADALQYDLGSGPCVDAITQGCVVAPIDLRSDPRWPHFGTKAADRFGFHSMLSLRLLTDVPDCAYGLNIYGARVHAFDDRAVLFALLVGTYASSVVRSSASQTTNRETILNLEKALQSNRRIGISVGILMASYRLTPERSFEMLRLASINHNRKLREIADRVVLTGTLDP
jgi:hypothetical protein